ncbi:predicted protein [Lichtheimia corymbifera JMRC:FSU:9682]|uniref:Uncharacterized protein n=1 Tax=Lichtheimia corymbifera JMRC:FSU:9682 TaxID=1263082 RepID=A0A068RE65_9FUNG|nr:predicted protein [Lichtheimia corymbifera JMRC:FSU:9682]
MSSSNKQDTAMSKIILQQAMPKTVQGHVVLVLVGTDISRHDFKTATPFFAAGRPGAVTKTLLCQEAAWANGDKDFTLDCFQSTTFPFINVFPWLDTVNTKKSALRQLYEYFSITKPLVVTGLGKCAATALFSNLLHHQGCGHRSEGFSYISTVALPHICYFVNDEWVETSDTDGPPEENSFIVIGNLDPGYERYGERSVNLIELMDLTWTATLLISEIVLGVLLHDPSLSRRHIIQESWPLIDPVSPTANERLLDVYSRAARLKDKY